MSDHDRVTDLFNRAAELAEPERSSFLDAECGDDGELRDEIEALLRYDAESNSVLATAGVERLARLGAVPKTIGPYEILNKIGEGGMGVVFRGYQREPIERPVAIKLVRTSGYSSEMLARFEGERHALSRMNHPGIATVFDAGATREGTPYIVMEFVEGVPITEYCETRRLDLKQRLRLFAKVCDAVQHAHRNATIHRDIKPSNVLVVESDDGPLPKIIDFGIAKALEGSKQDRTITQIGQMVGTPEYMSPEQAGVTDHAVDTRTDVYSLGILLYRLVTGVLPYDTEELQTLNLRKFATMLADTDPPKPSRRLSSLGAAAERSAQYSRTTPAALTRAVSGDLDCIVCRTIEREPERRYGSATELADDVRRHLDNKPVLATPPSFRYLARKWVRRHRAASVFTATVALLLVVSATVLGFQANRIVQERDRSTEFSDLLVDLFDVPWDRLFMWSPEGLITHSFDRLVERLEHRPVLRGRTLVSAGIASHMLGYRQQASDKLSEAHSLLAEHVGETHPWTFDARAWYGYSLKAAEPEESARILEETLARMSALRDRSDPAVIEVVMWLAEVHRLRRPEKALEIARDAVARLTDDTPSTLRIQVLDQLVSTMIESERFEEALQFADEVLAIDPKVSGGTGVEYNRATALVRLGHEEEALAALRRIADERLPSPDVLNDENFLSLRDDPRFHELAITRYFATRERRQAVYVLADRAVQEGRPDAAVKILEAIYVSSQRLGDTEEFVFVENDLAWAHLESGRPDRALALWERLLTRLRERYDSASIHMLNVRASVAAAHAALGDADTAIRVLEEAIADDSAPHLGFADVQRAKIRTLRGDFDTAFEILNGIVDEHLLYRWDIGTEPIFKALMEDPRYERLMDRMVDDMIDNLAIRPLPDYMAESWPDGGA